MKIEAFRSDLRRFERGINKLNKSCCFVGITLPQCHMLMEIGADPNLSATLLAERLNLDKSTISRSVDKMVNSGFIYRTIPSSDRRTINIRLSPKGQALFNDINQANNDHFYRIFTKIEPGDLNTFQQVFHKISHLI